LISKKLEKDMQPIDYVPACLGGIEVAIFGADANVGAPVVFFAHGRGGAMVHSFGNCRELAAMGMIAIAIEQRNHGRRTVDVRCNQGWNEHHAADMYSACVGTAMDVSLIIDMLPARLGIATDRVGMSGVSMGGHATLLAMTMDSRIQVGAPIIGGGDYRHLMELRAGENGCPLENFATYFSDSLQKVVAKYDPIHHPKRFTNRPLLMTNGEADNLVQIACNERFEAAVRPYYTNVERLRLSRYPGVGHAVPSEMWDEAKAWLKRWLLDEPVMANDAKDTLSPNQKQYND